METEREWNQVTAEARIQDLEDRNKELEGLLRSAQLINHGWEQYFNRFLTQLEDIYAKKEKTSA